MTCTCKFGFFLRGRTEFVSQGSMGGRGAQRRQVGYWAGARVTGPKLTRILGSASHQSVCSRVSLPSDSTSSMPAMRSKLVSIFCR